MSYLEINPTAYFEKTKKFEEEGKKNYHYIQCVYVLRCRQQISFFFCEKETDIRINVTMIFKQNLKSG